MKTDKEVFKELWRWVTENPLSNKYQWPGFYDEQTYIRHAVHNSCPACTTASERRSKDTVWHELCHYCPLRKSAATAAEGLVNISYITCLSGLYDMYQNGTLAEKARFAAIIRDLEWEDDEG